MQNHVGQLYGLVLGALGIVGANVAVCLDKIDAPTYIGIVGTVLGVGVGAGVHAAGTSVPTVPEPAQITMTATSEPQD